MTTDNLIHVAEEAWEDQSPRGAYVHVVLTGDRLFSGAAAFEQAVELRRLVIALEERDIPVTALSLTGATLDVANGMFTKSSSVTYRVRIHVREIERLADVLDAVAGAKQARISHLEWDYGRDLNENLLAECAARAQAKAKRLASALGVTLAALHQVHEQQLGDMTPVPMAAQMCGAGPMRAKRSVSEELVGLDLGPSRKVGVRVQLAYVIANG